MKKKKKTKYFYVALLCWLHSFLRKEHQVTVSWIDKMRMPMLLFFPVPVDNPKYKSCHRGSARNLFYIDFIYIPHLNKSKQESKY